MRCVIGCVYKTQVYFKLVRCWRVSFVLTFIGGFTEATGIMDIVLITGAMYCIAGNGLYRLRYAPLIAINPGRLSIITEEFVGKPQTGSVLV